ncbi:MAG: sulfite exporter TauE/SafE family protein [Deltaproteobacteria bacterium]|nr:sulfite exporter TauE/SafE family protein [Deltaproteobacteria bacterium]
MGDYLLLFTAGVLGALHCVAMCGALAAACGMKLGGGFKFSLVYNSGRLASYAALGALAGLIGRALSGTGVFGGLQSAVPVVAGVVMVAIGLDMLGLMPGFVKRRLSSVFPAGLLSRALMRVNNGSAVSSGGRTALLVGMLNGLVPCGLLYAAGLKAASTGSPIEGALVTLSLGAGTFVPMLFAGSITGLRLKSFPITAISSVIIIALGIKAILHFHVSTDLLAILYPLCAV